jgi:hypothetical protein
MRRASIGNLRVAPPAANRALWVAFDDGKVIVLQWY